MGTQTVNYLDLVERLPEGALLRLQNVGWDEYENLLSQMNALPVRRVTYDSGRLIIMSPSYEHEIYKDTIYSLIRVLADELGVDLETRGQSTFRSKLLKKGEEPDTCFYVRNAASVIGKLTIELGTDPPPECKTEGQTAALKAFRAELRRARPR